MGWRRAKETGRTDGLKEEMSRIMCKSSLKSPGKESTHNK